MTSSTPIRMRAVSGDLVELEGISPEGRSPFTSHVDVLHAGVQHQVLSAADRRIANFSNTVGKFTIAGFDGHIVERLDHVETGVASELTAVVEGTHGVLTTRSYDGTESLLSLVEALRPASTSLGMTIRPRDEAELATTARLSLTTHLGLVEIAPLSREIVDQLPRWSGTAVANGELFGGEHGDGTGWLLLVTRSCRVMVMPGRHADLDSATAALAHINVRWTP